MTIHPGVVIDGETVYPEGWEWILAFAVAGCQWAIDLVNSGELDGQLNVGAYI